MGTSDPMGCPNHSLARKKSNFRDRYLEGGARDVEVFDGHEALSSLFLLALTGARTESHDQAFHRNLERIADPKQCEDGARPACLDHLPVTHTESVRNHVFLAELPFGSKGTDAMAQRAEEALVLRRKLATGTHYLRLESPRTKAPRTKLRIVGQRALVSARRETGDPAEGRC